MYVNSIVSEYWTVTTEKCETTDIAGNTHLDLKIHIVVGLNKLRLM